MLSGEMETIDIVYSMLQIVAMSCGYIENAFTVETLHGFAEQMITGSRRIQQI